MTQADHLLADPERCVTASDLVRQFGLWQERALQQPIFILRRGRPSLVLSSLDLVRRLCAPHDAAQPGPLLDLLLDAMREVAIVVDPAGRIARFNRAARIVFPGITSGAALTGWMPDSIARFLLDLSDRARRSGHADQAEVAIGGRRMQFAIVPGDEGALLVASDITAETEATICAARFEALDKAIDLFDDVAWARINARGYIDDHSGSLARLAAVDRGALQAVRFVTLFDQADRSATGAAIDAVMADGPPRRLSVSLHGGGAVPIKVVLALSPEHASGRVELVTAILRVDRLIPQNQLS